MVGSDASEPWQVIGEGGAAPQTTVRCWLRRAAHVASLIFGVLAMVVLVPLAVSGRGRLSIFLGCCLMQIGWHVWLECGCFWRRPRTDARVASAIAELRREQAELRASVSAWESEPAVGGPSSLPPVAHATSAGSVVPADLLSGYRDFVHGTEGSGAYTHTGQAQGLHPPPLPPPAVPALTGGAESPEADLPAPGAGACSYSPLDGGSAEVACCTELKKHLDQWSSTSTYNPRWGRCFWENVASLEAAGLVPSTMLPILQSQGYVGGQTMSPPRVAEFKALLDRVVATAQAVVPAAPLHSGASAAATDEPMRWHAGLAADFQRAGMEIYRNIRAGGVQNVREYLNETYAGSKGSPVWTDLWTLACSVDFRLGSCRTEPELRQVLAQDDTVELALRRISAFVYESRTGDKVGASHMLGAIPPGTLRDIAPTWMVDSATAHSKADYQRMDRVGQLNRRATGRGDKGKGKGKSKDKGGKASKSD